MSTPTPDEITEALAILRRVPGVNDDTRLSRVPELASPMVQVGIELRNWFIRMNYPDVGQLISMLETLAAKHGLRITTDPEPGELIQYRLIRSCVNGWILHDHTTSYAPDTGGADAARADRDKFADSINRNPQVAAVYLLPEGGKA